MSRAAEEMKGPVTSASFSLVFAAGVEPLMARLSFQHSLARWTRPVERNEKPIAARCVFECEEEYRSSLEIPFRIVPHVTSIATRSRGLRSVVHADVLIRTGEVGRRLARGAGDEARNRIMNINGSFKSCHFPFTFSPRRENELRTAEYSVRPSLRRGAVFMKCKADKSEHHQDGPSYHKPMRILHRGASLVVPHFFAFSPSFGRFPFSLIPRRLAFRSIVSTEVRKIAAAFSSVAEVAAI